MQNLIVFFFKKKKRGKFFIYLFCKVKINKHFIFLTIFYNIKEKIIKCQIDKNNVNFCKFIEKKNIFNIINIDITKKNFIKFSEK